MCTVTCHIFNVPSSMSPAVYFFRFNFDVCGRLPGAFVSRFFFDVPRPVVGMTLAWAWSSFLAALCFTNFS